MKTLIGTFILCGALSVLAGEAVASEVVSLNCAEGECKFSEELAPDQTHEYRGFCAGEKPNDFDMDCHAVKGTTCTAPFPVSNYRSCSCTNWDPTQRKSVTIDLECED